MTGPEDCQFRGSHYAGIFMDEYPIKLAIVVASAFAVATARIILSPTATDLPLAASPTLNKENVSLCKNTSRMTRPIHNGVEGTYSNWDPSSISLRILF
jgi:hypothetical protein